MADFTQEIRAAEERMRKYAQEEGERAIREAVQEVVRSKLPQERDHILGIAKRSWEADIWSRMPQNARRKGTPRGHVHDQPVVGGGADCMFDYLVSDCWDGQEGQVLQSLTGCDFRVYSTINGAMAHAGALTSVDGNKSFYICHGAYTESVSATNNPPSSVTWDVYGSGSGETLWRATGNSVTLWDLGTMSTGSVMNIVGIGFDLSTGSRTSCTGLTSNNGLIYVRNCDFLTGDSTNTGMTITNTQALYVVDTVFLGSGTGWSASTAQAAVFSTCNFQCGIGASVTGNSTIFDNCIFNTSGNGLNISTGGRFGVSNSYFDVASTKRGLNITGGPTDNMSVTDCIFRVANSTTAYGIYSDPSVNSEGWTITSNTFSAAGSNSKGIRVDAQNVSGVVALNSFVGFTSGNEIENTGALAAAPNCIQIFHNQSSDGSAGANQALADFGTPVGHVGSGSGGGAPNDAQYVTLATNATLTAERVLTAGLGISLTDAGAGSTVTVATYKDFRQAFLLMGA